MTKNQPSFPSLLLDTSSSKVITAILGEEGLLAYQENECDALEAAFAGVESVLKGANIALKDMKSFIFCEGPGSVLGIRIAAMALRTWQHPIAGGARPCFAYQSLRMAAAIIRKEASDALGTIVAPSRMGRWNVLALNGWEQNDIIEIEADALKEIRDDIYFLDQRYNGKIPVKHQVASYDLSDHNDLFAAGNILGIVENPEAWLPEVPEYKKWEGVRHQ